MALDDAVRLELAGLVKQYGYERREEAFRLTSGGLSHDYVDGKHAVARGDALKLASQAVIDVVGEPFDAVGGPTMGADALAHGVALLSGSGWFSVRKEPKGHGRHSWVEGTRLAEGDRVVFVEDVVSTGASLLRAVDRVLALGVVPVAAVTLLDRSAAPGRRFAERGIRYLPLLTSADIGIDPLPEGPTASDD
ncbi:MAG TPA: phosphoribosyltransferase family protein [Acidimicrobiales bacterium]|nr:phosphoribosyltransferase family protein [Acidimicrobiales bacterium]